MPLTIETNSDKTRETIRILSDYDSRVGLEVISNKEKWVSNAHSTYCLLSAMFHVVRRSRRQIQ